jgi:acetyltransferase-like isoleucine patch superfamily enzyme
LRGGVVVGANAVVTKNLTTKNGVYVGIPAKLIKN